MSLIPVAGLFLPLPFLGISIATVLVAFTISEKKSLSFSGAFGVAGPWPVSIKS